MNVKSILIKGSPLMLVGEAPGEDETYVGKPFVGAAGGLLSHILRTCDIDRSKCSLANVFSTRPPANNVFHFFQGKRESKKQEQPYPAYQAKFLKPEFFPEIARLKEEVAFVHPKVIIALGGTALWALTGLPKISDWRGTCVEGPGGIPVLPTFHPAAILRDYANLPIVIADEDRAKRRLEGPLVTQNKRILIPQSKADLEQLFNDLKDAPLIAADVETEDRQITCISLAPNPFLSYVIPLWNKNEPGNSAWSLSTEAFIYLKLRELAWEKRLLFHNGTYDLTYLMEYAIVPRLTPEDTMLMQHAAQPEMRKSLGFMASLYLDNAAWKYMGRKAKKDIDKTDE